MVGTLKWEAYNNARDHELATYMSMVIGVIPHKNTCNMNNNQ